MPRAFRLLSSLAVFALAAGSCLARADDAAAVKEKLFQAKKEYDGEVQKFKQSIQDVFDKREELARAKGDKKAVDQVKADRDAFTKSGEPPPLSAAVQQRAATARTDLDKAYTAAIKDYLRLKEDADADAAEKERQEVLLSSAFLFGKRTHLAKLKAFNIKTGGDKFGEGVTLKIKDETVPYCVGLTPPSNGASQASYNVAGKQTALRARVGVPRFPDTAKPPASEVTFEVLGDGKSLWKSKPTKELDEFQTFEVLIQKVKVLTLRVNCPESGDWARACWLEPILVE